MTEPDFVRAKQKISDATNWRGDVTVSLGDDTVTFKHRLLNENEFLELKRELDLSSATDGDAPGNVGQTEDQERLLELQQKEDLTDEEENELRERAQRVAQQTNQIEDALGEKGYSLLMDAGRNTIEPSQEDVDYVYDLTSEDPNRAKELMGVSQFPNPLTKGTVREHLRDELVSMITDQPYPIKLNVGMQAFSETISILGNGSQK